MKIAMMLFGIALVLSPLCVAWLDGALEAEDEDGFEADFVHWFAGKSFETMHTLANAPFLGFLIIAMAVTL